MSKKMYISILDQLGPEWDGLLLPFLQNEPYLDKRFPELVKIAREKLPKAKIEVQTNGSLLTRELIESTLPYVDTLKVNDYTKDSRVIKKIKKFGIENEHLLLDQRIPENESLTNRAGNVEYEKMKHKKLPLKKFCIYPFKTAYIAYDGKLIICCMDWHQAYVMGDLKKNSLKEVWHNTNFTELRKSLSKSKRNHPLCAKCDFDGYSMGDFRRRSQGVYRTVGKIFNVRL
jgi:radical SAM protein with 4Fe4S-binding SPASM domain